MKPITRLTLAALLTTAVFGTAVADTDFGTLRHNPMAAIEAGDALGLEVIPRSELEEVRGEGGGANYLSFLVELGLLKVCGNVYCGATLALMRYVYVSYPRTSNRLYGVGGSTPCARIDGKYVYCN
jgi:hypothetical protein